MKPMNYRRELLLILQSLLAFLLTMALLCLVSCGTGRRAALHHEQTDNTRVQTRLDEHAVRHIEDHSLARQHSLTQRQHGGEWTLVFDSLVMRTAARDGCTVVYGGRISARDSIRSRSEHLSAQSAEMSITDSACTQTRTDLQTDSRQSTREDIRIRPPRTGWLLFLLAIAAGYGLWRRIKR